MINWNSAKNYEALLSKSSEINKPILLDLFSQECNGCMNIEKNIYQVSQVAELIDQHTLP